MFDSIKNFFNYDYLFSVPVNFGYEGLFLFFFILFLIFSILVNFFLLFRYRENQIIQSFRKKLFWGFFTESLAGLFLVFARLQDLPIFSLRIVLFSLLLSIIAYTIYLVIDFRKNVTVKLFQAKEKERVGKWLRKKA